jgi:hypothetical protein
MVRVHEQDKTERTGERAAGHDAMTAIAVDQPPDLRRDESAREKPDGETAHGKGEREAAFGREQRQRQDRRIIERAPGDDLRESEDRHGAPASRQNLGNFHDACFRNR